MKHLAIALAALACLALPAAAQQSEGPPDRVLQYADSNARMNGAIAEAQAGLPRFFELLQAAPQDQRSAFALKVALDTPRGGREHIWIGELRYENGDLVGNLANVPDDIPQLQLGSRVVIERERISDWMIRAREGLYGGYTMRVMIDDLSPTDAAQYRAALAPTVTPPGW